MKVGVVKRVVVAAIWELLAVCVCVECRSGLRGESENCLRVTITDAPGNAELSLTEGNKERLTTVPEEEDELVLNAEVTESGGEITAFGKLSPLTVTALHRNIAERDGKVRLCFDLQVSPQLLSSDRQLRILPILVKDKDTALLDRIFITGETYRSQQLKVLSTPQVSKGSERWISTEPKRRTIFPKYSARAATAAILIVRTPTSLVVPFAMHLSRILLLLPATHHIFPFSTTPTPTPINTANRFDFPF